MPNWTFMFINGTSSGCREATGRFFTVICGFDTANCSIPFHGICTTATFMT